MEMEEAGKGIKSLHSVSLQVSKIQMRNYVNISAIYGITAYVNLSLSSFSFLNTGSEV